MENKNNKQHFLNNFKRCMDLQTDYTDGLSNNEKKSLINLFESCKASYNEESISRYFSFKEYLSKHKISTRMSEKDILVVSQILSKEHLEFNEENIIRAMHLNSLSMKLGLFLYPYKLRHIFHLVRDMSTDEISSLIFGVSKKVMLENGTAEDKNNREKIYGELKKYTYDQFTDVDKEILRLINLSKDNVRGYYLNKGMKPHSTNELLVNLYENIKKRLSEESVELTSLTISEMEALRDFTHVYHSIAKHINEGDQEREYTQKDGSIIRKRRADKVIEDYASRFAKKTADRINNRQAISLGKALASLTKTSEKFGESETLTAEELGDALENTNSLLERLNDTKVNIVRTILQEYGNELNNQYADNPNFNGEINEAISKKIIKRCSSILIKEPSAIYESTQFLLGNNLKTVNNSTKDRFKKFAKEYDEDFKKVFEDEVIGADSAYNIMGNIRVDNIRPHHHLKYMNTKASIYTLLSVKNILKKTKFFINNIYDAIAPKDIEKVSFDKKIQYLTNNGYDVNTFLDGDNISTIFAANLAQTTFKNPIDENFVSNIATLSKIISGEDIQNIIRHNFRFLLQNPQILNNSIMALTKDAGGNKELFKEYFEMFVNAIPKKLRIESNVIDYKTLSKNYKCITTNNNIYINLTNVNMPEFEQTQEDNSIINTPNDVTPILPTEEKPLDIEKELASLQSYAISNDVTKNTVAEELQDMGKDNFVSPIRAKIKFLKHLDRLLESLENYDDISKLNELKNDLAMKEMDLADQLFILDKASLSYFRREREGKIIKESKHNYKEVTQNQQDHSAYMQILNHLGLKPNPSDELYSTLTTKMELDNAETERLVREKKTRKANERDFELIKLENTMLNELIEKLNGIIAQKSIQQAKDGVVTDEDTNSVDSQNVESQEQVETNQEVADNNTEDHNTKDNNTENNNQENSSSQTQEKKQGKKQDKKPQVTLANRNARIAELEHKIKKQWDKLLINRHYFQESTGKIITNWENSIRHSYFSKLLNRIKNDDKEYQDLTGESLYEALVRYFESNRGFRGSYVNLTNETLGLSRDIID